MAAAWGITHGFTIPVLHCFSREPEVAGWCDQFQWVAGCEFVFHVDGQLSVIHVSNSADHLLAAVQGGALFVVLVFLGHVAAEEAFGIAAV